MDSCNLFAESELGELAEVDAHVDRRFAGVTVRGARDAHVQHGLGVVAGWRGYRLGFGFSRHMKYRIEFGGSGESYQEEFPPSREIGCEAIPRVGELVVIAGFWHPVWLVSHTIDSGEANTPIVHLGPPSLNLEESLRYKDEERYPPETRAVLHALDSLTEKCLGGSA